MNCLVLGGRGFIGKNLCVALSTAGYPVRAIDLPPHEGPGCWPDIEGVNWISADFCNPGSFLESLQWCEVVFHLVSSTIPKTSNENPHHDLQTNVAATIRFLDKVVSLPSPPKVVFLSSGGTIYGVPEIVPIPETHPNNPLCAYGVGKLSIEKYLALYGHLYALDYCVLRLANPYGAHQEKIGVHGVIPAFLAAALEEKTLDIWGDGTVVRDYLHIDDACSAILKTLTYGGPERIFNIGSGAGISLNDLVEKVSQLLNRPVSCRYLPARECDVPVNILDVNRAKNHLGWQPRISIDEGMAKLLQWLQRH